MNVTMFLVGLGMLLLALAPFSGRASTFLYVVAALLGLLVLLAAGGVLKFG